MIAARLRPGTISESNSSRLPTTEGSNVAKPVMLQADQLLGERSYPIDVTPVPSNVHPHVAAISPTQVRKRLSERSEATLLLGIVFVARHERVDAPHPPVLLRPRHHRPRCHTSEPCDERPAFH